MHYQLTCGKTGNTSKRGAVTILRAHNRNPDHKDCEIVRRWTFPIAREEKHETRNNILKGGK